MLPIAEVQAVIYGALTSALSPVAVLDAAGPDQEFPYVTVGEFAGEHDDTLSDQCVYLDAMIHVWSRQAGMQQTQFLMEAIKDALHRQKFSLPGQMQWVSCVWEYGQVLRDPDGVTRHGVMRFRISVFQRAAVVTPV